MTWGFGLLVQWFPLVRISHSLDSQPGCSISTSAGRGIWPNRSPALNTSVNLPTYRLTAGSACRATELSISGKWVSRDSRGEKNHHKQHSLSEAYFIPIDRLGASSQLQPIRNSHSRVKLIQLRLKWLKKLMVRPHTSLQQLCLIRCSCRWGRVTFVQSGSGWESACLKAIADKIF